MRASFHTLGCKLNYAETATITKQFLDRGFEVVEFGETSEVCVINTCSVTEHADRECRQLIRKSLRTSPHACVIVIGCYSQLRPYDIACIEGVDYILGSKEKFDIFTHIEGLQKRTLPKVVRSPLKDLTVFEPAYSSGAADRTRAFLKVQDGCDYHCSFCTIPLARGLSRSQPLEDAVTHARDLVRRGYKEIVLTGVNVGDYGRKTGSNLISLLKNLEEIDGLYRLRISSIEPNLLTSELLDYIRSSEKVCQHFHIPLQSGSDQILMLMRRRYVAAEYGDLVYRIREALPDAGIGADVMVGFPGETDALFQETYLFLVDLPVSYLHVFTYSERPNTTAIKLPAVVDPSVRTERSEMLRTLSTKKRRSFYERFVGCTVSVLMEGKLDGDLRFGHTDHYVRMGLPADSTNENEILVSHITGVDEDCCLGRIVQRSAPGRSIERESALVEV